MLIVCSLALISGTAGPLKAQIIGEKLPAWEEGYLDIHQINAGKGDCAFFILPDGTTMIFDAGELNLTIPRNVGPRTAKIKPDHSRSPGEWMVHYLKMLMKGLPSESIDYAIISHFHDDHMGEPSELSKISKNGDYKLTGITTIGDHINIKTILDRGWPEYNYPEPIENDMVDNYLKFTEWHTQNSGMKVDMFEAGRSDQLVLSNKPAKFPDFEIRNVSVNGEVWTGVHTNTRNHFPLISDLKKTNSGLPGENPCSISIRLSYGKFDYFTGGDIPGVLDPGEPFWNDIETPVAKAVGPVEVNVVNHHGNRDSQNEFFVRTLRPQVHILPVWSSDHPGPAVLKRLLSTHLYPGDRELFATNMLEANYLVIGSRLKQLKSDQGHILVRVKPGGEEYHVIVLDDSNDKYLIKSVHGPYFSR